MIVQLQKEGTNTRFQIGIFILHYDEILTLRLELLAFCFLFKLF